MLIQLAIRILGTKYKETKRITIDAEKDVSELQEKIKVLFGIPINEQIIRYKTRNFEIRIISGFTCEFYEIGNNAILEVYRLEMSQKPEAPEVAIDLNDSKYNDPEEEEYTEGIKLLNKLKYAERITNLAMYEIDEEDAEEDEEEKLLLSLKKVFLDITTMKNKKEFQNFYAQFMTLDRNSQVSILQNTDKVGWSGMHYAVRYDEEWVINALMPNFGEEILSIQSADGWTPIFLAVQNRNFEILEILIRYANKSQIEVITSRGSLLHLIFKNCEFRIIQYLVSVKQVDPMTRNKNDKPAIELLRSEHQSHVKMLLKLREIPLKPVNVIYEVHRKSLLFGWMPRLMYLNSESRTLVRFKTRDNFPMKPREVIRLHEIRGLKGFGFFNQSDLAEKNDYVYDKQTGIVSEKSIYDKQENYIEFEHEENHHLYRFSHQIHARLVYRQLLTAIKWADYYEDFISKLRGAEYESAMPVWRTINTDFKTYDLLNPLQFTEFYLLFEHDEPKTQEFQAKKVSSLRDFHVLKVLGRGAFGKVYKVVHKKSQRILAMKVLNKRNLLRENQIKYSLIEKEILQNNPQDSFLLSLHFAFQSLDNVFMVIDYCPNEDLSVLLNKHENNRLEESVAKFYIAEIFLAINELHKRNYIYRDLKPENILLDEQGHIKLADFGLAAKNIKNANDFAKSFCGSPMYISPEILKKRTAYKSSDYYTMGVVLFELLTGEPPFYNDNIEKLYSLIKRGEYKFPSHFDISNEAKDLINKLICGPKQRLGALEGFDEIKRHPFFAAIDWTKLKNKKIEPPLQFNPVIHNFNQRIKIKDTEYNETNCKNGYIPNFDYIREDYD